MPVRPVALHYPFLALIATAALAGPAAAAAPPTAPLKIDFALSPTQIATSCKAEIATAGERIDALLRLRSARTFDTLVAPFETISADLGDNLAAQTLLLQVAPDQAVRDASEQCNNAVSSFLAEMLARPDLYAALQAAARSGSARGPAQKKLLELDLTAARRAGAGLPDAQRRRFVEIARQLTDLANAFNTTLATEPSSITISKAQTDGLKPDLLGGLKTDADGQFIVPVNESTISQFLANASSADARKAYLQAYLRRGGEKNVERLEQAIALRDESARLLGYANWAAYTTADRMAGTPQRVHDFLTGLDARLLPLARTQRTELGRVKGAPIEEWDRSYYGDQARKQRYDLDREAVRQYFPAQHTIDAVLGFYSRMLGLTFTKADDLPRWHPDVVGYRVADTASGADRGVFYLDLYPRPGKYGHFANMGPTSRRVMPDGAVRPAINTIVGNWPAPAPGRPSLLSHSDVVTFFHEFGHNVAWLCADTPYQTLNAGYRQDFVEAPSQMLENFVWEPAILKLISSRVDTGEPLPDALIAKMNAARHYNQAWNEVGGLFYALVDQQYHTQTPPVPTTRVWADLLAVTTPDHYVDGTVPQAGFGHLMSGYEGAYYAYAWSKVYAQDMYTAFQQGGLQNPAVGLRYRREVLAPARMVEPDVLVRNFLGRPMKPDAFYEDLGLALRGQGDAAAR